MDFNALVKECGVGMMGAPEGPIPMPPGPITQIPHTNENESEYQQESENMIHSQLHSLSSNTEKLKSLVNKFEVLEPWVQSKLTLAEDYISTIAHYLEFEAEKQQDTMPQPVGKTITLVIPPAGRMMP